VDLAFAYLGDMGDMGAKIGALTCTMRYHGSIFDEILIQGLGNQPALISKCNSISLCINLRDQFY
jgi:hypothetical protein